MCPRLSIPSWAKGLSEEDARGGVNQMSCLTGCASAALYLSLRLFKQTQTWDSNKEAAWMDEELSQGALCCSGRTDPLTVLWNITALNATTAFLTPHPSSLSSVYHRICPVKCSTALSSPPPHRKGKVKNGQHSFYWFGFLSTVVISAFVAFTDRRNKQQ